MEKSKTTKQIGLEQVKFLNSLPIFKSNKLRAVNAAWYNNGETKCDFYNMSNKKRVSVKTSTLFSYESFLDNPTLYLERQTWFNELLN